jgi:protoporphyrinogen oxidase
VIVIGAGPAGLTTAYELTRSGIPCTVLEASGEIGGISRTVVHGGYRFDLGGHRFFSKSDDIERMWDDMAPEPLLVRPRLSRIYYEGKFYDYPLRLGNALRNMGPARSVQVAASYLSARFRRAAPDDNFEEWVSRRFGRKLYEMFFKSYTEKVWGIPCTEISADWAAQRIRDLSLWKAVRNAILSGKGNTVTTLIDRFRYPALGPGSLWESCARKCVDAGAELHLSHRVVSIERDSSGQVCGLVADVGGEGLRRFPASHVVSSMPIRDLVGALDAVPDQISERAQGLGYRGFILVALMLDVADTFPDNWIYIHEPGVRVGRSQNFKNWSPAMVPDGATTCLGMEYFADPGDDLWTMADEDLIDLADREVRDVGLVTSGRRIDGAVVRVPDAYPMYAREHNRFFTPVREWLDSIPNLYCVGRNGQHRYNNMDHSMLTGIGAARSILTGSREALWDVNVDAEYHEEDASSQE